MRYQVCLAGPFLSSSMLRVLVYPALSLESFSGGSTGESHPLEPSVALLGFAHGAAKEGRDTHLATHISRINPGDQWGDMLQPDCPYIFASFWISQHPFLGSIRRFKYI